MKLPICKRLLCCAEQVPLGARVADIGCDHGYLGIELILSGRAQFVHACDLRKKPLEKAVCNATLFGTAEKMRFSCADGLNAVCAEEIDTVVCAGMGGDLIAQILENAPWVSDSRYTLVLQPQSSRNDLRRYLGRHGFSVSRECIVLDHGFLYTVMTAHFGGGRELAPAEQYASAALLASGDPLLRPYLERIERSLQMTVAGISKGTTEEDRIKLNYYSAALKGITMYLEGCGR